MDAPSIIRKLKLDGITLYLLPEGKLAARPSNRLTDRHRELIRSHKRELVSVLASPAYHIIVDGQSVASQPSKTDAYHAFERVIRQAAANRTQGKHTISIYLVDTTGATIRSAFFPP
ncbi:hypothetical protein NZD89_12175 [Alicyclobacillus fastidiosus]|uniref:TubC N-terminal docking domain-containing protein n=1 Tax=Alicyclobacillus fastidiosus TaxID=392011 RepID=A0ABY6ZMA7_9BACL|nr:hypothetical protein [Alicyclobacillus fastidiosus]WAH44063.1 hypothetical protein NZD89_12175 [Alicyclobacillus fastidiosus]GMA60350.1 hypothetical protein GCM10025859_07900 [Alicyclobacillus fastidiosus]